MSHFDRRPIPSTAQIVRFGVDAMWNNFDFLIMILCWMPTRIMKGHVAFIRLFRLLRLLKLVSKFKKLQIIVSGLIKGLTSVIYILILLFLVFYIFAILGVYAFRINDPFHFGNVLVACVTLFRISTLDNWTNGFLFRPIV